MMIEDDKEYYEKNFRQRQETLGNLSSDEIEELLTYEFEGARDISGKVRGYFLKVKSERPEKAEQMSRDLDRISVGKINGIKDVETLCRTIYRYVSGFVINYEGVSYTVSNNKFGKISDFVVRKNNFTCNDKFWSQLTDEQKTAFSTKSN